MDFDPAHIYILIDNVDVMPEQRALLWVENHIGNSLMEIYPKLRACRESERRAPNFLVVDLCLHREVDALPDRTNMSQDKAIRGYSPRRELVVVPWF